MYEPLLERGIELKAFTYRPHRYPLDDVRIPYEVVPNRAEKRTFGERVREGLSNRLTGWPIDEEPVDLHERLRDFDLIHTWELFSADTQAALVAKKRWGTSVLVTVWDNIPHHRDRDPKFSVRKQSAREHADLFLVYTHDSRKMLIEEGVDPTRIRLIPPAVDLREFAPDPSPPERSVLIGVGRMVPEKGFEDLIEAAAILKRDPRFQDVEVRLLGSGPHEETIDRLAETRDLTDCYHRISSLPYTDLPTFMRSGKVLVLASKPTVDWREQFGMTLIEAMASGVPVIGAQSGAIPEIVGKAGWLYQPGAIDDLVDGLREILGNRHFWEHCRLRGIERCEDRFSHIQNSRLLEELYRSLTG